MTDFFPKPNNRIITVSEALKEIKNVGDYRKIFPDVIKYLHKLRPGESISKYHKKGNYFGSYKLPINKPMGALLKHPRNCLIHPYENRHISLNELKILCSFPEEWNLGNNYRKGVGRLGNAVMPRFMEAIANNIKSSLSLSHPTVISTFAGTGGSSLGYKWAGFKELLAIEWENYTVECFKLNFPEVPVWKQDITKVTSREILDFCKIKKGELDVFDGSPPCQGFSMVGKRQVTDPRNDLFLHYWRLVKELQPKVFVMENVSGMIKGTMKGKFLEILKTLKSDNYEVKCKLMNSMYYGVPQSRQRLIFIGIRKDILSKVDK